MKRILVIIMIAITLSGTISDNYQAKAMERNKSQYSENAELPPSISAKGAILIEEDSSKVLFERDGNRRMYPASTTKILTALIAIENCDLNEVITIGDEIKLMDQGGSRAWLRVGEKMKLSDLIMGLMLPSGNDAAYTIALNAGRKIANNPSLGREAAINVFINKMNERALEIGAKNSHFVNPHGFHNNDHYTTPYDIALIAREALKYDFFKEVVKTSKFQGINTSNQGHKWENTNRLINKGSSNYYQYATGIKTGHTTSAGYCLVSSGSKDNMDVIAVVLNTTREGQFNDSKALLTYGLNSFLHYEAVKKGDVLQSVKVKNKLPWDDLDLSLISSESLNVVVNKGDIPNIKRQIKWNSELIKTSGDQDEGIEILSSLKKGQGIGRIVYTINGEILGELDIESGRNIKKRYWIFYLPGMMFAYENRYVTAPVGLLLIFGLIKCIMSSRRRRKNRKS